ncbi:MAG: CoA-binding protein [Elusimicrobiota bacterium]
MDTVQDLEALLNMRVVAVVGCSPKPKRPSNRVAAYLADAGYRVIPVNPGHDEILGEKCYRDLRSIPDPVEVVCVFRRAEFAADIVRQAIGIGAKGVWMQDGIDSPEAAVLARKNGLKVVMNDCIMRQHLSRFRR